jgi:hypothetical protein
MEFETRSMTNRGFKNHFHLEDENIMNLVDLEDEILKSKVTDVEATAGILQGKVNTPRFRSFGFEYVPLLRHLLYSRSIGRSRATARSTSGNVSRG